MLKFKLFYSLWSNALDTSNEVNFSFGLNTEMNQFLLTIFRLFFMLLLLQLSKVCIDTIKPFLWTHLFFQLALDLAFNFLVDITVLVNDGELCRDIISLANEKLRKGVDIFALEMSSSKIVGVDLFKPFFPNGGSLMLKPDFLFQLSKVSFDDDNFFFFCAELTIAEINKFLFHFYDDFIFSANFKENRYDFDPFLVFFFL